MSSRGTRGEPGLGAGGAVFVGLTFILSIVLVMCERGFPNRIAVFVHTAVTVVCPLSYLYSYRYRSASGITALSLVVCHSGWCCDCLRYDLLNCPSLVPLVLDTNRYAHYRRALESQGLRVVPVEGDGNCLFRSVSHQVYGNDCHHRLVRASCMDYMEVSVAYLVNSAGAHHCGAR